MTLITGATGFLGKALIKKLYGTDKIRVISRNEGKLIELKEQYPKIEIITGDIADPVMAEIATKGVNKIYHLAAFKHVGLAETIPYECINSNMIGTLNLLKNFRGELFVAISTDKAAQVVGVYGATKFLMERLIQQFEELRPYTKYRVVRYGNVLYSTGSVLCKWKDAMQKGLRIKITDPNATRFFWTIDQAIEHIFECIDKAPDSKPYIPEMKAMSIGKLMEAMMDKYGKVPIKVIGLGQGENKHETMNGKLYSNQVEQYTVEEIKELI